MDPGGSNGEEGRSIAIRRYRILALIMGLLSGGLFACGIIAVSKYPEGGFGPPYYIGGFVVGILGLLHALLCTCIVVKGADFPESDIKKRELACAMTGQYILSMFLVMGCFMSCVLAGIGGLNEPSFTADLSKYNESAVKTLTVVIIVGSIAVLLLDVFGMCIVCTYGSYFGVQINQRGRAAVIRFNQGPDGTMVITSQTTPGYNSGFNTANMSMGNMFGNMGGQPSAFSTGGAADVHSLQEQNRLLQEQVRLQQQLLNQQQQQQAGQFGYGMPPPVPGFAPSAPDAPPPSYDEVKR